MRGFSISGMISMNALVFLGIFANIGGLVFYFTSGIYALLGAVYGAIFQGIGLVLIYMGISLILLGVLSSAEVFSEGVKKKT
jgi:hypothetical protein